VIDVVERLQLRSIVLTRCAAIPLCNVANGSNLCENAREQRMRRNRVLPFPLSTATASVVLFLFNVIETNFLPPGLTRLYKRDCDVFVS